MDGGSARRRFTSNGLGPRHRRVRYQPVSGSRAQPPLGASSAGGLPASAAAAIFGRLRAGMSQSSNTCIYAEHTCFSVR